MKTFALIALLGLTQALHITEDGDQQIDLDDIDLDDVPDISEHCNQPCADTPDDMACYDAITDEQWDELDKCVCEHYP